MLARLEFHYLSIVLSKLGSSITTTNYPALCLSVCRPKVVLNLFSMWTWVCLNIHTFFFILILTCFLTTDLPANVFDNDNGWCVAQRSTCHKTYQKIKLNFFVNAFRYPPFMKFQRKRPKLIPCLRSTPPPPPLCSYIHMYIRVV